MHHHRAGREIIAASKLSHQTVNRNSCGIADHQHRQSAAKLILSPRDPFRTIDDSPRPRDSVGANHPGRINSRNRHRIVVRAGRWRVTILNTPSNVSPPDTSATTAPAAGTLSSVFTGRAGSSQRRITGQNPSSRGRSQGSTAADPITPAGSRMIIILASPDSSSWPVHRRRTRSRCRASGHYCDWAPEGPMAQPSTLETAGPVIAGGRTVVRRKAVEAPPPEVSRNSATRSTLHQ